MCRSATSFDALTRSLLLTLCLLTGLGAFPVAGYRQEAFIGYSEKQSKVAKLARQAAPLLIRSFLPIIAGDEIILSTKLGEVIVEVCHIRASLSKTEKAHLQVHIALLDAFAPKTCELVARLAQQGCKSCRFYRNELPPEVPQQFVGL